MTASISVVIPSFQHVRFVGEAVESALTQTLPPSEVVVVDDGSTDGSLDLLRGFGSRIRLLDRPHGGIGATYDAGLGASRSGVVAFLESDDAFEPDYLARTAAFLDERPWLDWVSTGRLVVDESGRPTGEVLRRRYPGEEFTLELFLRGELGASSTPVARRDALLSVGPWASDSYAADTDMALRFSLRRRMGYLDRPLYRYRRHGENVSRSLRESVRLNEAVLERLLREHADELGGREALVRRALAKMCGMEAALLMEEDPGATRPEVLPLLTRAVRLHPLSPRHLRRLLLVTLFGPRAFGAWRRARARHRDGRAAQGAPSRRASG